MKNVLMKLIFLTFISQVAFSNSTSTVFPGWSYCTGLNPCPAGYGDCDSDSECQSGLTCKQNVGANYGWDSSVDVCEASSTSNPNGAFPGWGYCTASNPCPAGYGDCDSDSECQSGLTCKQDVGANYGWSSAVDVCEVSSIVIRALPGDWSYCTTLNPCPAGYGDCDSDIECQSGLTCKQDVGANYGWDSAVDVCEAQASTNPGDWDYCSSSKPCSAGYGDCDSDSECQSGLTCKQDVGANYGWNSSVDVCEAQTLSAPTLITPYNGISNISTTSDTVFRWNSVNDATVYRIVISQDPRFSGFVDKGASSYCLGTCLTYRTSSTNYTKHGFNLSGHTYYWKVRAGNANSESLWSNTYRLTTKNVTGEVRINNVPFISQRNAPGCSSNYLCGFTTTAMVSSFINKNINPSITTAQDMAYHVKGSRCPNTLSDANDYVAGAKFLGLNAKYYWYTFDDIKNSLKHGIPAIVGVKYSEFGSYKLSSWNGGHSIVIVGYSESKGIWLIHDPLGSNAYKGAYREIPSSILRNAMIKAQTEIGNSGTYFDTVIIW